MVFSDQIPKCRSCQGLVKPDIVFFGESLPARFFGCVAVDFQECDLLIVMGTSLQVQPFAALVQKVPQSCPRLLINRESVGEAVVDPVMVFLGMGGGFKFGAPGNVRDVRWLGDVQQGAHELVKLLGWEEDFQKLLATAEPAPSL
ncbi:NADdependent deacetylase sirtuin 2, putative [Acanthamoeba castellanii str. Neff]|uniref:NADdependent deacetylase sirtuin 2, putative n=1 Tax=Acanthamoeba castellanii (strain ATCC 30010 / Neff) TaxID=1257118 RepID=L8GYU1_ACACF|nr:NADdependent deacetylase sirtuin 2, putative [Acanthamoeba castellanii str. Neff]ELR17703.1 NADdependent deacetylase sirtuin 2, putative [Acanthamoeba castellanii str. Neff]